MKEISIGLKNGKLFRGLRLLIPEPFNWITLKRRYSLLFHLALNFRDFWHPYKHLPDIEYINRLKENPEHLYRCLGDYLSLDFSIKEKVKIYKYHHNFMSERFSDIYLNKLDARGICIWKKETDIGIQTIIINSTTSKNTELEGVFNMVFLLNENPLFKLIFTHIPGNIIKGLSNEAIFIGCSQGNKRNRELWKLATKENSRLSPDDILLVALQAWAVKNNVDNIIGVNVENQVSEEVIESNPEEHVRTYDTLWLHNGAGKIGSYFLMPNVPIMKDKEERNNYRSRDKKIHLMRLEIYEQIQQNLDVVLKEG